ncbi:MAG: hypothetical protein ACM3SS_16270, partial [Rhodospirillaceae bacterium]
MKRLAVAVGALTFLAGASGAHAQGGSGPGGYPDKPVRVIVPVAAAGGTDIIARIVLNKLNAMTGKQFIVDNRA